MRKETLKKIYLELRGLFLKPFCWLNLKKNIDKREIRNILFLRHDRIGDMALSLFALKELKKAFPNARLTILASKSNHELLSNNPYIDEIIIYEGIVPFIKAMRQKSFDLAIDPFFTYEFKQAFLTFLSRAKYRLGFEWAGREIFFSLKGISFDNKKSFKSSLLELLKQIGIEANQGDESDIFITQDELEKAKRTIETFRISDKKPIAIHPGGFYPSQRWPIDRFAKVAKRLAGEQRTVLFFIPREIPLIDDSVFKSYKDLHIIRNTPLRDFISILNLCELLICNNSGPLHIAAELRIKTVSLMGSTEPAIWWPEGGNHLVLNKNYGCQPCGKGVCNNHKCLLDITIEEVLEKIYQCLK